MLDKELCRLCGMDELIEVIIDCIDDIDDLLATTSDDVEKAYLLRKKNAMMDLRELCLNDSNKNS